MSLARLLRRMEALAANENDTDAGLVDRIAIDVRDQLFAEQLGLLDDPNNWIAVSCGRQAGKNFTIARLLVTTALSRPNANCAYVNATYGEARRIMWADQLDGIPAVLRSLGLIEARVARLNESRLEVTFTNGSRIELLGADRGAWEKLRGNKFDLVCVDESQKLEDDGLRNALDRILPPCLASRDGRCVLIGTPDEFCVGAFHDICTGAGYPHFSHHHWDAESNDRRPDLWERLLRWKRDAGLADDDPIWQREGRGLWVRQDSSLILPLGDLSLWDGLLPDTVPATDGTQVPRSEDSIAYAGVDFGFTDATAVVVGSISREEGVLRELHSEKRSGLNTAQVADMLGRCIAEHGVKAFYGDAASATTIADLRQLHRLPIVAADKHDKTPWISEMRSHLIDGRLRVLDGSPLHDELRVLSPDPEMLRRRRIETRPGSDDHCYDAFRYLFRAVWTNHVRTPSPPRTEADRERERREELRRRALRPSARRVA